MLKDENLLFEFSRAAMRVRDRRILDNTSWRVEEGEQWAVLGPNGSGKSTLVRALTGDTPVIQGSLRFGGRLEEGEVPGYVSFEGQREVLSVDRDQDDARYFSGTSDAFRTVGRFLGIGARGTGHPAAADRLPRREFFDLPEFLDRSLRTLSSGELRKVFISRALLRKPKLLILDEPFDGLDDTACTLLGRELGGLVSSGLSIILVTHRQEEIFPWITHVLTVREGLITDQGPREEVLGGSGFTGLYALPDTGTSALNESEHFPVKEPGPAPPAAPVIEFDRVTVEYDGRRVLDNLTWTVRAGENWSILGPNGSGKTTILNLITRENLQSYANSIRVFGVPVDGGQSVWEARQRIGVLTPHLQTRYRKNISALDVILSGFFDSTGLYRRCSREQVKRAEDIALFLGIGHLAGRPFPQLSFGEQRLVLIARAMVKKPAMLILDEPCQGLDPVNRGRVLEAVERIGSITDTNLLYVTHRKDEIPGCITCVLTLPGMDVQRLS